MICHINPIIKCGWVLGCLIVKRLSKNSSYQCKRHQYFSLFENYVFLLINQFSEPFFCKSLFIDYIKVMLEYWCKFVFVNVNRCLFSMSISSNNMILFNRKLCRFTFTNIILKKIFHSYINFLLYRCHIAIVLILHNIKVYQQQI